MMMAGLDGIQNKIHPGDPMDKNLYDLQPEEDAKIRTVRVAGRGARPPGQGPRVPDPRRRVHQRHDRRLHGIEDGRSHAIPDDDASGRVRHVLLPVSRPRVGARGGANVIREREAADPPSRFFCLSYSRFFGTLFLCDPMFVHAGHPVRACACGASPRGQSLAQREAQGSYCKSVVVEGNVVLSKCRPRKAMSDFVHGRATSPGAAKENRRPAKSTRRPRNGSPASTANTQRERDDVRSKVLTEELAAEEPLLRESEISLSPTERPSPNTRRSKSQRWTTTTSTSTR